MTTLTMLRCPETQNKLLCNLYSIPFFNTAQGLLCVSRKSDEMTWVREQETRNLATQYNEPGTFGALG